MYFPANSRTHFEHISSLPHSVHAKPSPDLTGAPQDGQLCVRVSLTTVLLVGSIKRNVEPQFSQTNSSVAELFLRHGAPQRGHRTSTLEIFQSLFLFILSSSYYALISI